MGAVGWWWRTNQSAGGVMSQTPEMVEPHISMDKMASVQQNREMNHENPKHDEGSCQSTCNLKLNCRKQDFSSQLTSNIFKL